MVKDLGPSMTILIMEAHNREVPLYTIATMAAAVETESLSFLFHP